MSDRKFYYGKEELRPLQDYQYPNLFGEEKHEWDEFKTWLCMQKYTVLCSKIGFDNFLNGTIMEGDIGLFKYSLQKFAKNWPRKMYHLTDSGNLNTVSVGKQ